MSKISSLPTMQFRAWNTIHNEMYYFDFNTLRCVGNGSADKIYIGHQDIRLTDTNLIFTQWTGRWDTSNKKIYIGDIVKLAEEPENIFLMLVSAHENKLGFYFQWIRYGDKLKRQEDWDYQFKVMGNIFQNPELLRAHEEPETI